MKKILFVILYYSVLMSAVLIYKSHADEEIIGGALADPLVYPEVVRLLPVGCTGAIVGPRAVLTAAHCVKSGTYFNLNGIKYNLTMKPNPKYGSGNFNYDVAMALIDKPVDVKFAKIGGDVDVGQKVKLAGYGCTNINKSDYGTLYDGESEIYSLGTGDYEMRLGSMVCYGDSGSSAFDLNDFNKGVHTSIGITSRTSSGKISYMTRLDYTPNKGFLMTWAGDNETPVCGENVCCL